MVQYDWQGKSVSKEDMENLWSVFELQNTNAVPISELRIIMRALDFDLDPEQLEITR